MKKIVWCNKSNEQLCVTIPKNSGIKTGDIVSIEKEKIKKIVYSSVTGDLFHYGHLRLLQNANMLGDFHICGVLTDDAIKSYKEGPIAGLRERMDIIAALQCVDRVVPQYSKDPTDNLKTITDQFPSAKLILVHGSDWDKIPGSKYIKQVSGKIIRLPYYEKLSTKNVINKIFKVYPGGLK